MKKHQYKQLEDYMLSCMLDSAHDKDHIYRVLYAALEIAQYERDVDRDVLVAACLLHDIGRQQQYANPAVCHALAGAQMAYDFLIGHGWGGGFAMNVRQCIETHRFRADRQPQTMEAKILFDADKIDATGTLGVARTIFYKGQMSQPLYCVLPDGTISDGENDGVSSFFHEYRFKLEKLYDRFYTKRAAEIAAARRHSAAEFYKSMLREVESSYSVGTELLDAVFDKEA